MFFLSKINYLCYKSISNVDNDLSYGRVLRFFLRTCKDSFFVFYNDPTILNRVKFFSSTLIVTLLFSIISTLQQEDLLKRISNRILIASLFYQCEMLLPYDLQISINTHSCILYLYCTHKFA